MGCLDSSTARVAASRHQAGVVQMKISKKEFVKVKKWIREKQKINNAILLSIEAKTKTHSIYWLLMQQMAVEEARNIWFQMDWISQTCAKDIAV